MFIGLTLITIGLIALSIKLGLISGSVWGYAWPVILIILGLSFLWGRFPGRGYRGGWYRRWHYFPNKEKDKD